MADIKKIKLPNGSEYEIKDEIAREQMEVKSNKITALDSASTDSQYPSAKAVYDIIQAATASVSAAIPSAESDVAVTSMLQSLGLNTTTTLIPATTSNLELDRSVVQEGEEL